MKELKEKLIKYKELFPKLKKIHDEEILNELFSLFPTLNPKIAASMVLLDLKEAPCCLECNSPVKFSSPKNIKTSENRLSIFGGWHLFCSSQCSRSSQHLVEKRRKTNLERYGEESWAKTNQGKEMSSLPWSEEKKENFNKKSKETYQEKYGEDHFSKTQEYLEKRNKTTQEKYGVNNTFQLVDRVMGGHIKKYGKHHNQTEIGREKLSRNNSMKNPEIALKSFLNRRKKQYAHNLEFMNVLNSYDKNIFKKYIDSLEIDNRYDIADKLGISYCFLNALFRKYDMRYEYLSKGSRNSSGQRELYEFIKEIYNDELILSDRTIIQPKELDIYIPGASLAIEYNGIYYHSEGSGGKDVMYHVDKTNGCEIKGIQLLHIFETEWNDQIKQEIWKSIIRNKLGLITERIFARKCLLRKVSPPDSREFLDKNHLSGFCGAETHLGLFYNDELVSVLSYGKSRFKQDEYEIIRFASKINTIVVGAFGKFFKELPKNIITYSDRRYSSVLNCGYGKFFYKMEIIHPNWYGYGRDYELKHRMSFQKHILKNQFNNYDDSVSVYENMLKNNYDRIWDSGNLKFSLKIK